MKTYLTSLIILLSACFLFLTCAKTPPVEKRKTRLLITIRDDEGKSVDSTIVRLYKNASDTGITRMCDSTGILLYPDLDTVVYYWTAIKGCKNNRASQTTLNRPLQEGLILYGYSVLSANGTLKVHNSSASFYKIVDSSFTITLPVFSATLPADTTWLGYPKLGKHKIYVQIADTTVKRKDTTIIFKCGDTAVLNLPF
jgi:hypothetical protein